MANLRNVQFLRNSTIYGSLEAAKDAMVAQAAGLLDGSPILGRYTVQTGETTEIRTILGLVADGTLSFFNNDKEIDNILDGLDYSGITTSDAAVVTNVTEADGTISASTANVGNLKLTDYVKGSDSGSVVSTDTINDAVSKLEKQIDAEKDARAAAIDALDYSGYTLGDSEVFATITEENGVITATGKNLSGIKLAGYSEGTDADIAATDTLGEALGKLQAQINAMDLTVVSGNGEVITAVSEDDGKVSASKTAIKDVKLTGYVKDTTKTGAIAATDDIEDALSKLENKTAAITINDEDGSINVTPVTSGTDISVNIKSGEHVLAKDGGEGVYTDIKLSGITPSSTTVKEEFALIGTDGTQLGTSIKVYKDSSVVSITYITNPADAHYQNLEYTYIDVSGNTQTEYVDISSLVLEAEFASGVTVTDHVAHGVVDPTSEKDESNVAFLTVGADGFKISGIKDAIDTKINKLDADLSGNTSHVTVGVKEVDGKLTAVTVAENDIANASDLEELSGKTVTAITSNNSSITATISNGAGNKTYNIETDADRFKMSGFSSNNGSLSSITESDSISTAIEKIDTVITHNEEVTAAALTDLDDRLDTLSGKTFTEIGSENNSITFTTAATTDGTIKVNAQTDASKISGLTAVSDAAGEISGVTASDSVQTGIKNLYASLAAEIAARKVAISATTVSSGNAGIVATPNASGTTVTLTLDGTTNGTGGEKTGADNALTITNDGLFLSTNWDCGTFNDSNP